MTRRLNLPGAPAPPPIGDGGAACPDRAAERIREETAAPFALGHHEVFTSASVGITLSSLGYAEPDDMLRDADTAMYRAKSNGKGRYEVFDQVMHARAVTTLRLETELRRAVENGECRPTTSPS